MWQMLGMGIQLTHLSLKTEGACCCLVDIGCCEKFVVALVPELKDKVPGPLYKAGCPGNATERGVQARVAHIGRPRGIAGAPGLGEPSFEKLIPPDDVLFGDGFVELSTKRMVSRRTDSDVTGAGVEPLRDGRAKNATQCGVSSVVCKQRF